MKNAIGFVLVLLWAAVITPFICQFFSESEGWDWKQTLVALIGGPPAFAIGKAIGERMAGSSGKSTVAEIDKPAPDTKVEDEESK